MSFLAFLFVCVQAFLIQNISSQCIGSYKAGLSPTAALAPVNYPHTGALDLIAAPFVASVTAPFAEPFLVARAADPFGAYGGVGTGEVSIAGQLPTAGNTIAAGRVPVLGAVEFGGIVPAGGAVLVVGSCTCGCS